MTFRRPFIVCSGSRNRRRKRLPQSQCAKRRKPEQSRSRARVEPFKITCVSCRAVLTVRKESMIGQIIACPRCSMMVQVSPPAGHGSPTGKPAGASPTASSRRPTRRSPMILNLSKKLLKKLPKISEILLGRPDFCQCMVTIKTHDLYHLGTKIRTNFLTRPSRLSATRQNLINSRPACRDAGIT